MPGRLSATTFLVILLLVSACSSDKPQHVPAGSYAVSFDGLRGQLQVGGPYVGIEFHRSRPFPSRISFYAPVANSIDLSTDYWERDRSLPFTVALDVNGQTDSLHLVSMPYTATPAQVTFEHSAANYRANVAWSFGSTLPITVVRLSVANTSDAPSNIVVSTRLAVSLHTSHAYTLKDRARIAYQNDGALFTAEFDDPAADSARVFVSNEGDRAIEWGGGGPTDGPATDPSASFVYRRSVAPGDSLVIVQVIGSCGPTECQDVLGRLSTDWRSDVDAYEQSVNEYALSASHFVADDEALMQSMRWSRALLAADQHYIDGHVVPMPTPAQYNFFFTHDLLLTDLGAAFFDTDRVKRDLEYVRLLARGDSLLPHAYYWREDGYKTEPANPDNWNHLWFVIASSSYLKHSGDAETVETLLPIIRESIRIMLRNERNGLMYASRPDWWDIGNRYGARSYITTLMIRALRSYGYISNELGLDDPAVPGYYAKADTMQQRLVERLWDDDAGYLLNELDDQTVDRHYYTGSLLAAAFDQIDDDKKITMLATARRELLDENLGVRNAMPNDFHELTDVYRFNGPEVGAPFKYFNGGVWPQGIAWHVLALISAGRLDEASQTLHAYLSIDGIRNSPYGQPAFFEYREADPESPTYGKIDKTAFMWAGGWYLHVLYQLAGVRENEANISFYPRTPAGFDNAEYELMVGGKVATVSWSGSGTAFESIEIDGRRSASAVLTGAAGRVELKRGLPSQPYLEASTARVTSAVYAEKPDHELHVQAVGVEGQTADFTFVSPTRPIGVVVDGLDYNSDILVVEEDGYYRIELTTLFRDSIMDAYVSTVPR